MLCDVGQLLKRAILRRKNAWERVRFPVLVDMLPPKWRRCDPFPVGDQETPCGVRGVGVRILIRSEWRDWGLGFQAFLGQH
jgi:hypothetical protein